MMAYDEQLAERVRGALAGEAGVAERKMFGGLAFMHSGNMSCGIIRDTLMVRVGAAQYADALAQPYTREIDVTGRPMTGMVIVEPAGLTSDEALTDWVQRGVRYASSLPPK
jgi:TfoX/Sxy family transcriptional regulator of competence genes